MPPLSPLLPQISTLDTYRPIYRQADVWLPGMREICSRHDLDARTLELAPPGSNVLFEVDHRRLIKLFPPIFAQDCARESLVLSTLADQVEFEVPRVHFSGELEGWPYLVISRLSGVSLDTIWEGLEPEGREQIVVGLGRMMAMLHSTPTAGLSGLGPNWADFIQEQARTCLDRQREAGASAAWLTDIAAFYADLPSLVAPGCQPVLINADLNPEHIFCRQTRAGWNVTGIIDFGDAMLGHPYYEFVCPGFILSGQPTLRRIMLLAYGLPASTLNAALTRQMTAHILLHRFITVTQLAELFPQRPPQNMRDLMEIAWSF
jgi:hygromycin-B 7''-O-kinase